MIFYKVPSEEERRQKEEERRKAAEDKAGKKEKFKNLDVQEYIKDFLETTKDEDFSAFQETMKDTIEMVNFGTSEGVNQKDIEDLMKIDI